jgi:hypothetical protein
VSTKHQNKKKLPEPADAIVTQDGIARDWFPFAEFLAVASVSRTDVREIPLFQISTTNTERRDSMEDDSFFFRERQVDGWDEKETSGRMTKIIIPTTNKSFNR